ncbi:ABC transporter substrate-binding protein [Nocardia caishijiensis]|uniref:Peptide/nickel transport system substrate-binding protein n=1 Tax=Nocardia caishijiensis TaxID=184756 RepID=A0ABQ6YT65_9NOCA|nr:ABC transporter substrate-binding protein [Nocardia caishijiensis]KAF0848666.1 peptide/nickel transport system substrate-binding protein [Nocardia caishijiensis]
MSLTRRQLLQSGIGLTAVLLAAACTSGEESNGTVKPGGTLRVGALGTAARSERDPHANLSNESDFLIASLVYDALTVPGDDPNVVPRLASRWEADAENRRWTFTIAPGAKFHNGAPVTAEDVVWSMRRLRSVGGASKMPVAENDIAADGPDRVVFTVPAPNTQLPLLLRLMTFTVPQGTTDFAAAVGSGPFRLESYQNGNARLVRNENWHGTPPSLDAIEVTMFDSVTALGNAVLGGQIDLASNVGAIAGRTAAGRGDLQVIRRPDDTMLGVAMRAADGPFADARVRTALRLGVDREALINQVHSGFGTVAADVLGTADPLYDTSLRRSRDIERAKTLLREANFDTGRSYPFVTKAEVPGEVESAKVIATQLAEIGVRLDVQTVESAAFYDQTWLNAPLYTVSWGTNDSVLFLADKLMTSGSNRNETAFRDPEFDAANAKALAATGDEYGRAVRELQRIEFERGGYLVWGMADGVDIAAASVRGLPTLGGFARVQLERAWLA